MKEEVRFTTLSAEVAVLRCENRELQRRYDATTGYLRAKVDQLLSLMGTLPLAPEELDDEHLISVDPIGVVTESFRQVLDHLHETNDRLTLAGKELHAVLDAAGAGIMVVDHNGRIQTGNRRLYELFAQNGEELRGRYCHDAICRGLTAPENCVFERVRASGFVEQRNDWTVDERHFEVVCTPVLDQAGEISQAIIIYNEITARIRNEQALRDSLADARAAHERVDAILRSVADPLFVVDEGGTVQLANPAAGVLAGRAPESLAGLPLTTLFAGAQGREQLSAVLDGEAQPVDIHLSRPDGRTMQTLAVRAFPLNSGAGEVTGRVVVLRDVTNERAIEQMKSEFVSTAAHELRTPLATILGFSELLMEVEDDNEERREYVTLIHDKAENLSGIVDKLLDISRIEAGEELPLTRTDYPLAALIEAIVPAFVRKSPKHRFVVAPHGAGTRLWVDPETILQVLENVVGNAVKYSPAGGEIVIGAARVADGWIEISVADQGIGMSAEQLEHVFDKFYRADASNTAIRGTGLGMTIVRHIVEAHGGRIWLESRPDAGTTVRFLLPEYLPAP